MGSGWLESYRDPLFFLYPVVAQLVSVGSFAVFAFPLTYLAWKEPESLKRFRIQNRRPRAQDLFFPSIGRWTVNNLLMFAAIAAAWPLVRLGTIHAGPLPRWYEIVWQFLFFVYLDDFLFYWMHRTLHQGRLYRSIHAVHHRILTPWAITAHYMHPVEYILTGSLALVGPSIVGAHVLTVWIWIAFRQWEAAEGHCGYAFPWSPSRLFLFSDSAWHHDFHHAKIKGNYAGFFSLWDRVFRTPARGWLESMEQRRGEKANSSS